MFGHAGIKLEKFLVTDLTDKGLKRIGQAVELSYSNMQKLLIKHIVCANYQLSHYLTQLCGLAKQEDRFSCLGLQVNSCLAAYRAAGSFTAKTAELQQVIDGSVKYIKTFFLTILRLSDETIPPSLLPVLNKMFDLSPTSSLKILRQTDKYDWIALGNI